MNLVERLVSIGRCTKVIKGGRKFSFSAIVVVGDKAGMVGYGLGKAAEVIDARQKAINKAKKTMHKIILKEKRTIYHETTGVFCSSKIIMKPAPSGKGIIAGGAIRALFDVLGIKDIFAKSVKSNNPHNMIKAAIHGLLKIRSPKLIINRKK